MINYTELLKVDTLTNEQQETIIKDFVNEICVVPSDIRSDVYCEELRELIIFTHKERMKEKPITYKAAILQGILFAVVIELQRRNVYLSEEQYKSIAKQFSSKPPLKHVSDPYLVEKIKPFVLNENCHKEEPPQIGTKLADLVNVFRDDTETEGLQQCERLSKEDKAKALLYYYESIKDSQNPQSITSMVVDRMFDLGMEYRYATFEIKNGEMKLRFNQRALSNTLKNNGIIVNVKTLGNAFRRNFQNPKHLKNIF